MTVFLTFFTLVPVVIAFYLFLNKKNTFWVGLLLGLAFCLNFLIIFEFIFLLFWLLFFGKFNFKKIFLFCLAFILPISLLFSLYYLTHSFLATLFFSTFSKNFDYLSTNNYSNYFLQSGILRRIVILVFIYLSIWFFAVKKIINHHLAFLLFWFSITIFASLIFQPYYPHYLIQSIPPIILLINELLKSKQYISRLLIIIAFFSLFILIKNNFNFHNSNSQFTNIYQISNFIRQNTNNNQKIFIWGNEPSIYFLSHKKPIGLYAAAHQIIKFNAYPDTIEQLKINFPKYIIYFDMKNQSFHELDQFINRYYFPVEKIGSATIFQYR